jgi:hypothetical protein
MLLNEGELMGNDGKQGKVTETVSEDNSRRFLFFKVRSGFVEKFITVICAVPVISGLLFAVYYSSATLVESILTWQTNGNRAYRQEFAGGILLFAGSVGLLIILTRFLFNMIAGARQSGKPKGKRMGNDGQQGNATETTPANDSPKFLSLKLRSGFIEKFFVVIFGVPLVIGLLWSAFVILWLIFLTGTSGAGAGFAMLPMAFILAAVFGRFGNLLGGVLGKISAILMLFLLFVINVGLLIILTRFLFKVLAGSRNRGTTGPVPGDDEPEWKKVRNKVRMLFRRDRQS